MNLDLELHLFQYLNNPESSKAEWNVLVKEGLDCSRKSGPPFELGLAP